MTRSRCCEDMIAQVNLQSPFADNQFLGTTDKRYLLVSIFNEYGLICPSSPEVLVIIYCPFCEAVLPPSRRNDWFRKLESTGWQTWDDPVPQHMLSPDWDAI